MRSVIDCMDVFRRMRASNGRRARAHQRTMAERKAAVSRVIGGASVDAVAMDCRVSAQTVKSWVDHYERAHAERESNPNGYRPPWMDRWLDAERPALRVVDGGAA